MPRCAVQLNDQSEPYALECRLCFSGSIKNARSQQRRNIVGQAPRQLGEHALFSVRPRNLVAVVSQVVTKGGDDLLRIQRELNQTFIEIEEVATLVPLEKRAELGAEELFGLVG